MLHDFRNLGWDKIPEESHLNTMLREAVLMALVTLDHEETVKEGIRRFQKFLDEKDTPLLPPDMRRVRSVIKRKTFLRQSSNILGKFCYMLTGSL